MIAPESKLTIPLSDGKTAYSKLRGYWSQPLIIAVHGLTGSMDEVIHHELSKFFSSRGYAFLRFNLYDWHDDARNLRDTTLATHASDLTDVVNYARKQGSKQIHVLGHSYGGLTLLLAKDLNVSSGILLDSSHPEFSPFKDAQYVKELDGFIWGEGTQFLIGRPMVEFDENLSLSDFLPGYKLPTLLIAAGAGILQNYQRDYYTQLHPHQKTKLVIVPDATHTFDTDESRASVAKIIAEWIENQ